MQRITWWHIWKGLERFSSCGWENMRLETGLDMVWICSLRIMCWKVSLQCDAVQRWGLWGVIGPLRVCALWRTLSCCKKSKPSLIRPCCFLFLRDVMSTSCMCFLVVLPCDVSHSLSTANQVLTCSWTIMSLSQINLFLYTVTKPWIFHYSKKKCKEAIC